jgi:hypothetical protein
MSMTFDAYDVSPEDLDRLHGEPAYFDELAAHANSPGKSCSLEKAWHGLHYLLTGTAWEAEGPTAFIAAGGREIAGSEGGYGAARTFTPKETQQIDAALSQISDDQLWARFDADTMTAEGVYPVIWDEPEEDLKEEYLFYFHNVKQLVTNAAAGGHGLMVMLT